MTLGASSRPLAEAYDAALLDLDGVLYVGAEPVAHAADAVAAARSAGMKVAFVTNNASRLPAEVAGHLQVLGVPADPDEVATSAQAAARLLADRLPPGAAVLVTGATALRTAVEAAGLRAVDATAHPPAAVVQGYTADMTYALLAEAALAVRAGALWVATNTDSTMPSPRGLLPGNGALVAAVATATGEAPLVAGKPQLPLHREAVQRTGAKRPLVVGDRLDTDIEGAVAAGVPSLLVLTGVCTPEELLAAPTHSRPTYVAADLRGLLRAHPEVGTGEGAARCGDWTATVSGRRVHVTRAAAPAPQTSAPEPADADVGDRRAAPAGDGGDDLDWLRAAAAACWSAADSGVRLESVDVDAPERRTIVLARQG